MLFSKGAYFSFGERENTKKIRCRRPTAARVHECAMVGADVRPIDCSSRCGDDAHAMWPCMVGGRASRSLQGCNVQTLSPGAHRIAITHTLCRRCARPSTRMTIISRSLFKNVVIDSYVDVLYGGGRDGAIFVYDMRQQAKRWSVQSFAGYSERI